MNDDVEKILLKFVVDAFSYIFNKNLLTEMLENFDINSGEKISRYKSNKEGQIQ